MLRLRDLAIGLVLTLSTSGASGEYLAHRLLIRNVDTGTERQVTSTLDDQQYPGYYPVSLRELVIRLRSWRCPGNTSSFKPICPDPETQARSD